MKNILKVINNLFAIILIISCLLLLTVITYTFIDLYSNTYFDVSSKESIVKFFSAFHWGKSIIGSTFIMFSVFYAFQSFKVHNENRLFNNYLIPKEKKIYSNLRSFEDTNKMLYNFCIRNSREIMSTIISRERNNRIENKQKLEHYFNKYVKKEIVNFERSGYYGTKCSGNCNICSNDKEISYVTNSYDHFDKIAFDLFCISLEYSDFEEDFKNIYIANCDFSPDTNRKSKNPKK